MRRTKSWMVASAPALLALGAFGQASIVGLGSPPAKATGISADGGTIVGYDQNQTHLWSTATPYWTSTLGGTGALQQTANGGAYASANVNDVNNNNYSTAARYVASTATWSPLPGLGSSSGTSVSTAYDISADGQTVVGLAWVTGGEAHAFKWTPTGGTVDVGLWLPGQGWSSRANAVSADGNVIVGRATQTQRAIRWAGGTGTYLGSLDPTNPIYGPSDAAGVSGDGTYVCGNSYYRAYVWDAAHGFTDLGAIGTPGFGNAGYAVAVSDDGGTVVGWSGANVFNSQAIIWRRGMAQCESLRDYLWNLGVYQAYNNWSELKIASGVSADGLRITGWGVDLFGSAESFLVTLPPIAPEIYCTAKTNSLGCVPQIAYTGWASSSSASPFFINASQVLSNRNGLLFYGFAPAAAPFQGGFLCVTPPTLRTQTQNSFGTPLVTDCTGTYTYDFDARIQSGFDPNLVTGAEVYAQYWMRDPGSTPTTGLTDAVHFRIYP